MNEIATHGSSRRANAATASLAVMVFLGAAVMAAYGIVTARRERAHAQAAAASLDQALRQVQALRDELGAKDRQAADLQAEQAKTRSVLDGVQRDLQAAHDASASLAKRIDEQKKDSTRLIDSYRSMLHNAVSPTLWHAHDRKPPTLLAVVESALSNRFSGKSRLQPLELAEVASGLASRLVMSDDFAGAEKIERQVADARTKALGPDDPQTVKALSSLAACMVQQGKWTEAASLARQVIAAAEKQGDPDDDLLKSARHTLLDAAKNQGRIGDEEQTARLVYRVPDGDKPINTTVDRDLTAYLLPSLIANGKLDEAERIIRRAIAGLSESSADESRGFKWNARLLNVLRLQGRMSEASALEKQLDASYQFMLQIERPYVSTDYAARLMQRGDLPGAERCLRNELERLKSIGSIGLMGNETLRLLGDVYEKMGRHDRAAEFRRQIISVE